MKWRWMIPVLTIVFLFMAPSTSFAASAHPTTTQKALASCSGNGCNNTDPFATGCVNSTLTNASIVAYVETGDVIVYLWYSSVCKTNFTTVDAGAVSSMYAEIDRASGTDGGALSYHYSSSAYLWINTNQVYSPNNKAQACGYGPSKVENCTGYF